MTMRVLLEKQQIGQARRELIGKGASVVDSPFRRLLRKLRLVRGMAVGDSLKSWDVLTTINFLDLHVAKDEPILDIGCFASELIVALYRLGYAILTGMDLNPDLKDMPHRDFISYEMGDFMHTRFADASFRAITSISVIEHGFDGPSLLRESSRLLKPGGYFMASLDYWPEKIDTADTQFFGMDWKIFSKSDVADFIAEAQTYGLFPVGELNFAGKDRVIDCGGRQYTFAWLALRKRA